VRARASDVPHRAARARPSRRDPDHRSHERRRAPRGAGDAQAAAGPRRALSPRIAVTATAPFGADVLERLAGRHEITCLVTRPDAPSGRGRRPAPAPAKVVAERLGIPVLEPERLAPGLELEAPVVVAVAYGLIVPDELLPERMWLNVHPSLLPRWRGAAPVERALMAGDDETGVTIIRLVHDLDAGPVAARASFAVAPQDDARVVDARAAEAAEPL